MLRLYGSPRSRAFRCIWMLEETGADYEVVPTGWANGDNRSPGFLAINPNGKIPALVDEGLVLWESLAINLHLARQYGGALKPVSVEALALAERWSFWAMGEFEGPIDAAARFGAELPDDWAAAALGVLNQVLASSSWLAGNAFGVADLNVAVMFQRPRLAEVDRTPWPHLHAWLKRCRARPAFARMIERGAAESG
jgi:glutathione S-transferase